MKKLSLVLLVSVMGILLAAEEFVPLRTLYVSTLGDDKNSGLSAEKPLRSIAAATGLAQPGDLVLVAGGRYPEILQIAVSGTAENPIVFRGQPGETALLDGGIALAGWRAVPGQAYVYEVD